MSIPKLVIVTGGLGFIGKHFVRRALANGWSVKNIDSVSYAADLKEKAHLEAFDGYHHIAEDIQTIGFLPESDLLVNFAAESHVDNAITSNRKFCETNFLGTQHLLELVRAKHPAERPIFIQISTDEVYGDVRKGEHHSSDMLVPSNPYSATKAAADMLIKSWGRTYDVDWNIIRPTNNYGIHQYPEKLIPKSIWRMNRGLPAMMHGDGSYIRTWLHVEDTVDAINAIIDKGERRKIYNVGGNFELQNIEVLRAIAKRLGVPEEKAWKPMGDRSGQDVRYSLDDSDARALGWAPKRDFFEELDGIVKAFDPTRFS